MQITRSSEAARKHYARSIFAACKLFVLLWLAAGKPFAAERDPSVDLNIVAGTSLEEALLDLAPKVGLQLASATAHLAGRKTPAVQGQLPLTVALTKLLQGTGLGYKIDGAILYVSPQTDEPQRRRPKRTRRSAYRSQGNGGAIQVDDDMSSITITTATHIRGDSDRENSPQPGIVTLSRADFDASDFQSLGEAMRALPQNFPGGQNPDVVSVGGSQNIVSLSGASSVDLHGMGSSSTLILLNGQRLATAESSGAVDLTGLPIAAVERVDIVTGGVSAVYGSDAVAGAVNVVLRDKFEGWEARSALGGSVEGGGSLQHYSLIGGRSWDNANAYVAVDCTRQQAIDSSQRDFVPTAIAGTTLLPDTRGCSSLLSATGKLEDGTEASLVGLYATRANDTTTNFDALTAGVSATTDSSVTQYVAIGTVGTPLVADWRGFVTSSVSADNVDNPQQLMKDGVPYLEESNRLDNHLRSIEMRADGTLFKLPAGPWKSAAGAGYNEEAFLFGSSPPQPLWIAQQRRIRYLFAEELIPLLSWSDDADEDGKGKVNFLSLRVAGRRAWYSDVGATSNPKITLLYESARNFSIGASWGTSYRAPTLVQQYNPSQSSLKSVPDPGGGSSLALFQFGGNPRLRPEVSSSSTVDFAFTPQSLPDTLVKITWYNIEDRKRVEYPSTNTGDPLSDPDIGPFVTRNPSATQIATALARSPLDNQTGGAYSPSQATVLIDDLSQNISRQRASGADLFVSYGRDSVIGHFKTSANVAYLDLGQQLTRASPNERLSGTVFYPPNLRSRLGLTWNESEYVASLFFNYTGSSRNTGIDPPQRIGSWETLDATLGYIIPKSEYWPNTRFTLSAKNLLNRRPPFVRTGVSGLPAVSFDSTNASATGGFVIFGVALEF